MARRYQLDDPALQEALDELAARDTSHWPEPDTEQRAQLTRLLSTPPPPAKPTRRRPAPQRRAA